jgi:putative phosphotransacetylase
MIIPVAIEARHVRLSSAHVALLFGRAHALHALATLEHTARFAAAEVVAIRGPAGVVDHVRVLGPAVNATTVFVNRDDMALLGLDMAPALSVAAGRESATCSIEGPSGSIVLGLDAVRRLRRLVVTNELAGAHGLTADASVDVVVHGERARELRGVHVEIGEALYLAIDVADANAVDVSPTTRAWLSTGADRSLEARTADVAAQLPKLD